MIIRQAKLTDEKDIIDICFETSSDELKAGGDKELLALRWALYYVRYQTSFCFVAEEDNRVIGYILSTPDTQAQEKDYAERMIPLIKEKISPSDPNYGIFTYVENTREIIGDFMDEYPAHLHINLTGLCQGKGIGSKLMKKMEENLRDHGVKGVFLGVHERNEAAIGFYKKNNYKEFLRHKFSEKNGVVYMGKSLL